MPLYFISLGLYDELDMSLKALKAARECDILFAEFYTQKMNVTKSGLESLIGKKIRVLSRKEVEEHPGIMFELARKKKVGFLVGGDVFCATTHQALRQEALKKGIETKVVHGSSIISAVGETGLHIYKFGELATIPFPERVREPHSTYDKIKKNKDLGLHTLLLLDMDADREKYMSAHQAMKILLTMEGLRKERVFTESTQVVVFGRAGSTNPLIVYGKVGTLLKKDLGEPPFVIIVPSKLHFTEKEYLTHYRVEDEG